MLSDEEDSVIDLQSVRVHELVRDFDADSHSSSARMLSKR